MDREPPHHVVVAGGGIAALELVLALRAAVGDRCAVTIVVPDPVLRYRPEAVAEPFSGPRPRTLAWPPVADALGVELVTGRVRAVDGRTVVVDGDRARIDFDELVVAAGARAVDAIPHASTFRPESAEELHWAIEELEREQIGQLVLVAPRGCGWTLPLYELALMAARRAADASGDRGRVTVVTHEALPLEAFRGAGSDAVAALLDAAGVRLIAGHEVVRYDGARLTLHPSAELPAGRVIALPALVGPGIHGLPLDGHGFVRVDERFAVPGHERVHAIGDAAAYPLKQGGLATQQADAVAAAIAARVGARRPPYVLAPRLRAILWTGGEPLYLLATMIGADTVDSQVARRCPWWPPEKIAAVHAAPFLADVDELGVAGAIDQLPPAGRVPLAAPVIHATAGDPGIDLLAREG
ncbi:FAD-dependent oxidoreductase [Patulibacter defluvii]|uniref:FAD-dependent oxidoreductase n=1 Tax=Patulibacter defluvii TaxID=3095358 RepID=UPI002A75A851|nr:FAD-dependent oxidoreductase [Patulibacter sp. DM4]